MTGTLADCSDFSTNNLNIIYFKILILEQRFVYIIFSIRKSFLMEKLKNQSIIFRAKSRSKPDIKLPSLTLSFYF